MNKLESLPEWTYSYRFRAWVSSILGLVGALAALRFRFPPMAPLVGWDVGAFCFVMWTLATTFRLDAAGTARLAATEDPDRIGLDVAMVFAGIASLGAVAMTLIELSKEKGPERNILMVAVVASVALSWLLVHTIYTLVYARHYYDEPRGGIDFNSDEDPDYRDFAYMAFTLGMTYQVSDTVIKDRRIRRVALNQAAIAYLFGTVIVATTVNLVASLAH